MHEGYHFSFFFFFSFSLLVFFLSLVLPLIQQACVHNEPNPLPPPLPHEWPYKKYRFAAAQPTATFCPPPPGLAQAYALSGLICRGGGFVFVCIPPPIGWWLCTL